MVSFRRIILALAVLALFTGLASAQVFVGTGSTGGQLVCTANVANPTQLRAEGHTELIGDIVIQCTGGTALPAGAAVPTANITVALNNTYVTSRVFSNGLSEALLLIDEPGATAAAGPGAALPQVACANNVSGGSVLVGAGPTGCATQAGFVGGSYSAVLNSATTVVPNVFQGIVPAGSNQVIFNGIPILAPVTAGFARTFRITNIRASAAQIGGPAGQFQGLSSVLASISISNGLLLQNPVPVVGSIFTGLASTGVRNADQSSSTSGMVGLPQCGTASLTAGSVLRFTEGFASAFKTRVQPTATYSGVATNSNSGATILTNTLTQNVPGTIYSGSESGLIIPVNGGTAGLADFGTRLKATFNNVPTGFQIFVSTTNINPAGNINVPATSGTQNAIITAGVPNNTTNSLLAALVIGESAGASAQGSFLPLQSGTNNSGAVQLFGPLMPDANGTATAVWEILTTNPTQAESAEFAVYYAYTGNQATNTPPLTPTGTVSMSFAPTTSTFAGSSIPRFAPSSTSSTLISISQCTTTLLFPFVNSTPGFDTGIAIANTSQDPFSTKAQAGNCSLYFFGTTTTGTNSTAAVTFPATGNIAAGTVAADQVSTLRPGFQGYVIASCNFQLAHGYALFSDTGIRNWATGYLALVLPTGSNARNSGKLSTTIGANNAEGLGN